MIFSLCHADVTRMFLACHSKLIQWVCKMEIRSQAEANMSASNFLVSIQRQENQGWQGSIQWLDTGKTVHFRSELEMLLLIEEATQMSQPKEEKRSWEKSTSLKVLKNSL